MTSGLLRDGVLEPNPAPPRSPSLAQRHLGDRRVPYDPLGNPDWRMEGREMEEREEGQNCRAGISLRRRLDVVFWQHVGAGASANLMAQIGRSAADPGRHPPEPSGYFLLLNHDSRRGRRCFRPYRTDYYGN
jgi:hypothetical protein